MGSALLLGSGLLAAQTRIQLDGVGDDDSNVPLVFAQETLPTLADPVTGLRALSLPDNLHLTVKPRRAINSNEEVYIRIDLSGAYFAIDPTVAQGPQTEDHDSDAATPNVPTTGALGTPVGALESSGGAGSNFWIAKLGTAADGVTIASANLLGIVIAGTATANANDLSMAVTSGTASATITAYEDPDDAFDQVNAKSTFAGSGTIISLQTGLAVTIKAADTSDGNAIASVDHGFLWFVGPTGQARLGWLGVEEKIAAGVRNANNGAVLAGNEILKAGAQVGFNLMGNLDIGAFNIKEESFEQMLTPDTTDAADATQDVIGPDGNPIPNGTCDVPAEDSVDQGDLVDADGMPLISEDGDLPSGIDAANFGNQDPDVYLLCVNVDVMGPETNMNPIPEGDYSATAYIRATATAPATMVGEAGDLASIGRNGASVDIPYLTTSEKHNQRLIIVNRGSRPVAITSIQFTTEEGTEVELMDTVQAAMDAGLLVVPANASWVARMDETIEITGDSRRVAASLGFAATPGALSVATTQVNVSDGSTDTVVYTVD